MSDCFPDRWSAHSQGGIWLGLEDDVTAFGFSSSSLAASNLLVGMVIPPRTDVEERHVFRKRDLTRKSCRT